MVTRVITRVILTYTTPLYVKWPRIEAGGSAGEGLTSTGL